MKIAGGGMEPDQEGNNIMSAVAVKNNVIIKQHHAIHAHMKFLISAVGKLDLQTCLPHIADSKSLKERIALYRWSLNDFKQALQRDAELAQLIFPNSSLMKGILKQNQKISEQIDNALTLVENAFGSKKMREELNVILVKVNLAVNTVCETVKLNMAREDELVKTAK